MTKVETEIFENVLSTTGFNVKCNYDGLYTLGHKYSQMEAQVQTNGYNLLYSLQRLTNSDLAKDALR